MKFSEEFRDKDLVHDLARRLQSMSPEPATIMEVCGTHTMSVARFGLKMLLPPGVKLISGPGCPVCVTSQQDLDGFLALADQPGVVLVSFGDMVRVPGSLTSLDRQRAAGADVRIVYSPFDAVDLAQKEPAKQFVFFGVGFETTMPATALAMPPLPRKKGQHARAKASQRGTRIQQQRHQELDTMLANLPCQCDIGAKKNSQGHENYWRGYKLHLDVADGQIPISAVLTGASVHDSQVAIPLMTMTSQRVVHLYELMDSAYDADAIHAHSRQLNHAPIIAPHPRRGTKKPSPLTKVFPARPTPQLSWAEQDRFRERTMVERVNARLKDEFGASHLRVRGAVKVMAHLMFGVLALTVDQWLRMAP